MNTKSWSDIKDSVYGVIGSVRRDDLEREADNFNIGLQLRQAMEHKYLPKGLGRKVNSQIFKFSNFQTHQ